MYMYACVVINSVKTGPISTVARGTMTENKLEKNLHYFQSLPPKKEFGGKCDSILSQSLKEFELDSSLLAVETRP